MVASVIVVGLNHRTAPVQTRERLAVAPEALDRALAELRAMPALDEAVLVATCNRVEVYAATENLDTARGALQNYFCSHGASPEHVYVRAGQDAELHAFRVCASLDSLVVGEPQILGQVKEAVAIAQSSGASGYALGALMRGAFKAAKRVRTETGIGAGKVSVASVAVDLARGIFGELDGRQVLLVGAGKMALGAARSLVHSGARLAVANRSFERAEALAREHTGTAHPLTDLPMLLHHADVVVCSTASQGFVLTREQVQSAMRGRRGRALFLVDIAVPRNIDPRTEDLDSVYLYNVDDLERIVADGGAVRSDARGHAERLVEEELLGWRRERHVAVGAAPTIAALRQRFTTAATAEFDRSLQGRLKHLDAADRAAISAMLEATISKLLHPSMVALRSTVGTPTGDDLVRSARQLFGLDEDHERDP